MNRFGEDQTFLSRGSSASWAPDSKAIAYHRSASLTGRTIAPTQPGTATSDSDIFVIDNLGDFHDGLIQPRNLTNSPDEIDDDADWSPLGDKIVYVSKDQTDAINHPTNPTSAELFVRNADGTGAPTRLTFDSVEERAPTWSPDGARIVFMCRFGPPLPDSQVPTFELCVINADGSGFVQLTNDPESQITPAWSPDGSQIVYHTQFRNELDPATPFPLFELIRIDADGTGREQITNTPGLNFIAKYGLTEHVR
jgi:Tol biopolymer transport system component